MSTAEVEAALTGHLAVAEAAVVSRPHKVKGECLYCFVTLKDSREFNHMLVEELKRLGEAPARGGFTRGMKEKHSQNETQILVFGFGFFILLSTDSFFCILFFSERENRTNCHARLHSECSSAPENSLRYQLNTSLNQHLPPPPLPSSSLTPCLLFL